MTQTMWRDRLLAIILLPASLAGGVIVNHFDDIFPLWAVNVSYVVLAICAVVGIMLLFWPQRVGNAIRKGSSEMAKRVLGRTKIIHSGEGIGADISVHGENPTHPVVGLETGGLHIVHEGPGTGMRITVGGNGPATGVRVINEGSGSEK